MKCCVEELLPFDVRNVDTWDGRVAPLARVVSH